MEFDLDGILVGTDVEVMEPFQWLLIADPSDSLSCAGEKSLKMDVFLKWNCYLLTCQIDMHESMCLFIHAELVAVRVRAGQWDFGRADELVTANSPFVLISCLHYEGFDQVHGLHITAASPSSSLSWNEKNPEHPLRNNFSDSELRFANTRFRFLAGS